MRMCALDVVAAADAGSGHVQVRDVGAGSRGAGSG